MAEYIERETIDPQIMAEHTNKIKAIDPQIMAEHTNKIKTIDPHIIVGGNTNKPYYSIRYYDTSDNIWHIGFSSYELKFVVEWLKTEFNVVESEVEPIRHGKNITQINPVDEFICSECGFRCGDYSEIIYEEDGDYEYSCECVFNYCPRCGAKMDGSEEE